MLNDMEQANVQTRAIITLQLPSKYESITQLEALIEEIADKYQVSDDTFANMMTCLNEAVVNAIVHGNKLDAEKTVIINADVEPKRVIWTVTDKGNGL
jgi:serine/threonine-protein kinase RsbW